MVDKPRRGAINSTNSRIRAPFQGLTDSRANHPGRCPGLAWRAPLGLKTILFTDTETGRLVSNVNSEFSPPQPLPPVTGLTVQSSSRMSLEEVWARL